jgi:hypothetical protein
MSDVEVRAGPALPRGSSDGVRATTEFQIRNPGKRKEFLGPARNPSALYPAWLLRRTRREICCRFLQSGRDIPLGWRR